MASLSIMATASARRRANQGESRGNEDAATAELKTKLETCPDCTHKVRDGEEGIQCEICMYWHHSKCQKMSHEEYKVISANKQIHWYCRGCNKGMVNIVQTLASVQERQNKMEEEISKVKKDLGEVRQDLGDIETNIEKKIKESEKRLQRELTKMLKEAEIESFIEAKMVESAEMLEAKHIEEMEKLKTQITESDKKIEGVIDTKMIETREEERNKAERRNNVIIFGVGESDESETIKRIAHDRSTMNEILGTLMLENASMNKLIRLGKPATTADENGLTKPRPMKVVFDDEHSKNELLRRSKDLRKTKFKNIFIVQDQTLKERDERKQLMKERDEKRKQGQDMVVFQGKLVPRKPKPPTP